MSSTPFIIKVKELLKEIGAKMEVAFEEKITFEEKQIFELVDKIKVNLVITNSEQTLLIEGKISGKLLLKCSRCLKPFIYPFSLEIEEQFAAREKIKEISQLEKKELTKDDFIFPINPDETIDLKELIRQNILMNLPIKPLCSPDCPRVEKSLPEAGDPRLGGLKDLKNKLKRRKINASS